METIKEFGSEIEQRKYHASVFEEAVINNSVDTVDSLTDIHNQPNSPRFDSSQAKCMLSIPTTSDSSARVDNESLGTKNKFVGIFYTFKSIMLLQYSKECLGFIALILTTYATLLNKEPVIGGTISPKPIFALDSIVQEWPYGNLADVQLKVAVSELTLIYFYAPWCAESLFAREVYNSIANLYNKEAYFGAVNCWQPNSGCRTLYSNVYKWPVLIAYLPNALSVQYNGDLNFHSLAKFIDALLSPIVRIHNTKELLHLRIANDAVVFGVFKSCDTKKFEIFFQTAIKWLESSSFQNTKFAVYVGEDTSMFLNSEFIQSTPVIKLFTPNDTIIYSKAKWASANIVNFLKHQIAETSIWINLPSMKSATIYKHLQRGPVLLMFSPRVSLSNHYFIMKQLINAFNSYPVDLNNSVLNEYISDIKREYPLSLKNLSHFCDYSKRIQHHYFHTKLYNVGVWGDSLFSMGSRTNNNITKQVSSIYLQDIDIITNNKVEYCQEDEYQNACSQRDFEKLDYRTPAEILRSHVQKRCLNLEKLPKNMFEKGVVEPISSSKLPNSENIINRTLTFLMLDSIMYPEYLRNFIGDNGIQDVSSSLPSKLVIIENNGETLHMQKGPISTKNAFRFVSDFYQGKLNRHLRSLKIKEKNSSDIHSISIKIINSQQFLKIVNRTNVTSVVLFYTPQCSLCYIMSQTLLHISQIIKLRDVKFYRIDGSANEVRWEYTMDKFPSLIIFPQNRPGETNIFPSTLQISVKNVFSFILSKLNAEQRVNSLINACILTKLSFAFQNCVGQVRGMISNEISHQLRSWNASQSNQTLVLTWLQELKRIYLGLLRVRKAEDLKFVLKDIIKYENERRPYLRA